VRIQHLSKTHFDGFRSANFVAAGVAGVGAVIDLALLTTRHGVANGDAREFVSAPRSPGAHLTTTAGEIDDEQRAAHA
jgi:hypothetical protein